MTWLEFENRIYTEFKNVLLNAGFVDGDLTSSEELAKKKATPFFQAINDVEDSQKTTCIIYDVTNLNARAFGDNQVNAVVVIFGVDIVTPNSLQNSSVVKVRQKLEEAFENSEWTLTFQERFLDYDSKKKVLTYTARKVFEK